MRGTQLSEVDVRNIVSAVLSPVGSIISYARGWDIIQESALNLMLSDVMMGQGGVYKGGKLLDDVIDSLLCLAAAVAYAKGESHVYVSGLNLDDGHIIGPGVFALPQSV